MNLQSVNVVYMICWKTSLRWILRYAERNNMDIPDRDKIIALMNMAMEIENKLPPTTTEFQQRNKTTDDQQNQIF